MLTNSFFCCCLLKFYCCFQYMKQSFFFFDNFCLLGLSTTGRSVVEIKLATLPMFPQLYDLIIQIRTKYVDSKKKLKAKLRRSLATVQQTFSTACFWQEIVTQVFPVILIKVLFCAGQRLWETKWNRAVICQVNMTVLKNFSGPKDLDESSRVTEMTSLMVTFNFSVAGNRR